MQRGLGSGSLLGDFGKLFALGLGLAAGKGPGRNTVRQEASNPRRPSDPPPLEPVLTATGRGALTAAGPPR
jgi:hypothetical protein